MYQNLTVDAYTLTKYTHQVSSIYLKTLADIGFVIIKHPFSSTLSILNELLFIYWNIYLNIIWFFLCIFSFAYLDKQSNE